MPCSRVTMERQIHADNVKHEPPPSNKRSVLQKRSPEKNRRSHNIPVTAPSELGLPIISMPIA